VSTNNNRICFAMILGTTFGFALSLLFVFA
jgi:hypothetical protein